MIQATNIIHSSSTNTHLCLLVQAGLRWWKICAINSNRVYFSLLSRGNIWSICRTQKTAHWLLQESNKYCNYHFKNCSVACETAYRRSEDNSSGFVLVDCWWASSVFNRRQQPACAWLNTSMSVFSYANMTVCDSLADENEWSLAERCAALFQHRHTPTHIYISHSTSLHWLADKPWHHILRGSLGYQFIG